MVLDGNVDPLDESIALLPYALVLFDLGPLEVPVLCVLLVKKSSLQAAQVDQTVTIGSPTYGPFVQKARDKVHPLLPGEPNGPAGEEAQHLSELHDQRSPIGLGARQGTAQVPLLVHCHELSDRLQEFTDLRRVYRGALFVPVIPSTLSGSTSAIIPESIPIGGTAAVPVIIAAAIAPARVSVVALVRLVRSVMSIPIVIATVISVSMSVHFPVSLRSKFSMVQ